MTVDAPKSQEYELIEHAITDGDIPISHYYNKITGLRVVTAFVECPIVKGDLVFATEAFDDDGLPHTLEHLVFLGSEDFPYKGVLDLLANKSLAQGTNAYTDTDHTNYTFSTAGTEGFLNLLPIYLDHVLFPTLTDSAYLTEVHHINGEGENAGTVYCEMQGRENDGESRCYIEMLRSLYPGKCGYKSETGGILENLRTSTNNEKVRDYHKKFYHSKNLCIIVTGPIHAEEVFKAIKKIEDKIVARNKHLPEFERPWQTPVEPLPKSLTRTIQYSSETDDDGLVFIAWRGPNVVSNYTELYALSVFLDYLDTTAISPIQREFVECQEPLCSSICHSIVENSTSFFYLTFESVKKQCLQQCSEKLFSLLNSIKQKVEALDMNRIRAIISRKIFRLLSLAETSPHTIVVAAVIGNFLYGCENLKERCQEINMLKEFEKKGEEFWLAILDKYFVGPESRFVCIVGEPSPATMASFNKLEAKRIEDQKTKFKDELPEIAKKLEKAIEFNDIPAPLELLNCVSIPSIDSIKFHSIERHVLEDGKLPFRLQYDSIKTNFITIQLLMNTSSVLSKKERLYLSLLSEILLESSIQRDGTVVPYETVVAEIFSDTISYACSIGLSSSTYSTGSMSMLFNVAMQVEVSKYKTAVNWYKTLLYNTIFTADRIKTIATRMISDIQQYKRSGSKVSSCVMNAVTYQSNSNHWASNFMRQQKFLKQMLKDLKSDEQSVISALKNVRDKLAQPQNILVHLSLNKDKIDLSKLYEPWLDFIPKDILASCPKHTIDLKSIMHCHELIKMVDEPKFAIVGVGSIDSNYMHQLIQSIKDFNDPDLPAVYVLLQYLTQLEGPLWRQVRGLGLSYSYSIYLSPADGLMSFDLYKSTAVVAAYKKVVEIVERHLEDTAEFDDSLIDSAKSSLIFEFIKREKSSAGKSIQSLIAWLRDTDINMNRNLISRVSQVTKQDLRRVGPRYLKPLFDTNNKIRSVVCCNSSKLDEIVKTFKSSDIHYSRVKLDEESFINDIE